MITYVGRIWRKWTGDTERWTQCSLWFVVLVLKSGEKSVYAGHYQVKVELNFGHKKISSSSLSFSSSQAVIPAIQLISVPAHINWYSTFLQIQLAMKYRDCLLQSVGLSGISGTVGVVRSQSRDVLATCRELCYRWRYRVCGTTGLWATFACAVVGPSVSCGKTANFPRPEVLEQWKVATAR